MSAEAADTSVRATSSGVIYCLRVRRILISAIACLHTAIAAAPVVTKVEPPDWVAQRTATTLRILLTGANLSAATVESDLPTSAVTVSASGTHLFLDLKLPAAAKPGPHPLHIRTHEGACDAPFAI